ncbi:hypothetical protein KI387_029102, partial [Taxus chinensis]
GKLRETEVGQDILDAFRKDEEEKMELLLKKYIMLCSNFKVKAEALTVEKGEAHKAIVGLISELRIRKLVIGTTSSSSISRKMKLTGDRADYVQKHVPDFCKLFIVCKGKLVYLKGQDDPGNPGAFKPSMNFTTIGGFEGKYNYCFWRYSLEATMGVVSSIFYFIVLTEYRLEPDQGTSVDRVEGFKGKITNEQKDLRSCLSVSKQPESCIVNNLPSSQFKRLNLPNAASFMPNNSRGPEQDVDISPYRDSADIDEDIERYFDLLVEKIPDYGGMRESESAEHKEAAEAMEIISPDPHECLDQNMETAMDSETLKMRLNQVLNVAENAKNTVFTEAEKSKRAEWATRISLEKANCYEDLYHKEIRQKEERRELLRTARQQILEISRQRDEVIDELEITGQSLRILENLMNEVSAKKDHATKDLQNVLENVIKLKLQIFRNRKERDSALREMQTHHNRDEFQLNECLYKEYSYDDKDAISHAIHLEEDDEQECHEASEDVMQDPHIAADGFTYELESIKGWIDSGHDTSPMTNLKLGHNFLIPNYSLLSAIRHWQQRRLLL